MRTAHELAAYLHGYRRGARMMMGKVHIHHGDLAAAQAEFDAWLAMLDPHPDITKLLIEEQVRRT